MKTRKEDDPETGAGVGGGEKKGGRMCIRNVVK